MKVKIIANNSPFKKSESIEKFIGQVFEVHSQAIDGCVNIHFNHKIGTMTVYPNEYEIIDITKELKEFVESRCRLFNLEPLDVIDFILEHQTQLVRILK